MIRWIISLLFFLIPAIATALEPAYEDAPVLYSKAEPQTPLTEIRDRIKNGESLLEGRTSRDVLVKLLKLLDVPIESQVLVYSKTSAQNSRITPEHPRAIYFSDNAYIGWVQNGDIEVITFDENLGMVFHLLELSQPSDRDNLRVRFNRDRSCLNCHGGSMTRGWPGALVRSVYPSKTGHPILHAGTFLTDHSSPLDERWGGWYVTGESGEQNHLGNIIASENDDRTRISYREVSSKPVNSLEGIIETSPYPAGGSSDIVALMIMEHQIALHNALVRGNLVTRQTLYRDRKMKEVFGDALEVGLSETNRRVIQSQVDAIVDLMLFADEHVMTEDGVEGSAAFQNAYAEKSRLNSDGRSLRDLRLYERLFKHRCSFLIHCDAFGHLPVEIKTPILEKIHGTLSGKIASHLSVSECTKIRKILDETLSGESANIWGQFP